MTQRQAARPMPMIWGLVSVLFLLGCWIFALFFAPSERNMGEVYRIIYVHVPSAFTAFGASLILCIHSIRSLRKPSESILDQGKSWAEVGLIFSALTLLTGSIWGRPTWGVWWTWDARLTTTFLLALLYAGYLLLHASLAPGGQRTRACAILGILIFIDVPIIYKSVTWWRTLHQPPSLMRAGGSTMSPEIQNLILISTVAMLNMAFFLAHVRRQNLRQAQELEALSFSKMS